jgi:hypothetical protein
VNDPLPPARLDLLRFLERVQEGDLARTRKWIADEERLETERRRGEERRPPTPDWVIELGIGTGRPPVSVHAGWCRMGKRKRPVSREDAIRFIVDGVQPCGMCHPHTELGLSEY